MATNGDRVGNRDKVIELVESIFADHEAADLLDRLSEVGIPSGKVRTVDEVYEWPQTRSQGLLVDVDHPTLGTISLPGPPLRFFEAGEQGEVETTHTDHRPPPLLDADADAVRAWLEGQG
jgi:crotonobetainyl-CoA:carnitine CoA-transferase CaiB-like acyl-CoA transferase